MKFLISFTKEIKEKFIDIRHQFYRLFCYRSSICNLYPCQGKMKLKEITEKILQIYRICTYLQEKPLGNIYRIDAIDDIRLYRKKENNLPFPMVLVLNFCDICLRKYYFRNIDIHNSYICICSIPSMHSSKEGTVYVSQLKSLRKIQKFL